jgi:hypothetical protein
VVTPAWPVASNLHLSPSSEDAVHLDRGRFSIPGFLIHLRDADRIENALAGGAGHRASGKVIHSAVAPSGFGNTLRKCGTQPPGIWSD